MVTQPFEKDWDTFVNILSTLDKGLLASFSEQQKTSFASDLQTLYQLLIDYNQKINLTRITDETGFLFRHVLDSLTVLSALPEAQSSSRLKVLDLGSGGGFPVLPLLISRPDLNLTAVESIGKKCQFLTEVGQHFNALDRLTVVQGRAEELGQQLVYREKYDFVTARAVAALPTLLEWTLPFLKPGGYLLAIKGSQSVQAEIDKSTNALQQLKGKVTQVTHWPQPQLSHSSLVVIKKTGKMLPQYPRPAAKIKKKPL